MRSQGSISVSVHRELVLIDGAAQVNVFEEESLDLGVFGDIFEVEVKGFRSKSFDLLMAAYGDVEKG